MVENKNKNWVYLKLGLKRWIDKTRTGVRASSLDRMLLHDAMSMLGLQFTEISNKSIIDRAWRTMIKKVHPDKHDRANEHAATQQTQLLNQAKDMLLERLRFLNGEVDYERVLRDEQDEKMAREKVRKDAETRQQAEKERRQEEYEAIRARVLKTRRERYAKNRKKRAPGSRIHRKIDEYEEGAALVEEMQTFFRKRFEHSHCNKIMTSEVLTLFLESREATTDLEQRLFKRHCRRLFFDVWPKCSYSTRANKRCFEHVGLKQT